MVKSHAGATHILGFFRVDRRRPFRSPICRMPLFCFTRIRYCSSPAAPAAPRSEEHTSELQSLRHLVCRLLVEKKKKQSTTAIVGGAGATGPARSARVVDI